MVVACIGLGANLGDAEANIQAAARALGALPGTHLLACSPLYRTPAWGNEAQPAFINAAASVETSLQPLELLQQLLDLERVYGRVRLPGEHWGPRLLDLDLLLYGDQVVNLPQLQVPHPWLHERAFALLPLADVLPAAVIPGRGSVQNALACIDTCGIEPIGG